MVAGTSWSGDYFGVAQFRGGTQIWSGQVVVFDSGHLGGEGHVDPFEDSAHGQWQVGDMIVIEDLCDEEVWQGARQGCGDCKVSIGQLTSCNDYCHGLGRSCRGAWAEANDRCEAVDSSAACSDTLGGNGAICRCSFDQAALLCWIRMPTGCAKPLRETDTPKEWFVDPHAETEEKCNSRVSDFNNWCGRTNGMSQFGYDTTTTTTDLVTTTTTSHTTATATTLRPTTTSITTSYTTATTTTHSTTVTVPATTAPSQPQSPDPNPAPAPSPQPPPGRRRRKPKNRRRRTKPAARRRKPKPVKQRRRAQPARHRRRGARPNRRRKGKRIIVRQLHDEWTDMATNEQMQQWLHDDYVLV